MDNTWQSVGANDSMRHPEECDLMGGETDVHSLACSVPPAAALGQITDAEKLAAMWLGAHYADEYDATEIEAFCWKILRVVPTELEGWSRARDSALAVPVPPPAAPDGVPSTRQQDEQTLVAHETQNLSDNASSR